MADLSRADTGEALAPFVFLKERLGFVPNLFRAQALLPGALEAQTRLAEAILFAPTALSRLQKERLLLAVASSLGSLYCVAAHHRFLEAEGCSGEELRAVALDPLQAPLPAGERRLLEFALRLAWTPARVTAAHVESLRRDGLDDARILDAVLLTALTRFLCCQAAGLNVDPDFAPPSWQPGKPAPPVLEERPLAEAEERPEGRFPAPRLTPAEFPPFRFFQESFGFVPRLFQAQAGRPDVVSAEAEAVRRILLDESLLSRLQKESILLAVSARNLNSYCVAVHCEMLRALGVDEERSGRIAVNHREAGLPAADVALLDCALELARAPAEAGSRPTGGLRGHGFSEPQILETVAMVSMTQFLNTLQMGLGVSPDFPLKHGFLPETADFVTSRPGGAHPTPDEDLHLVRQAQQGDLASFEALVRRHDRRVYRTLIGVLGAPEDAEDALQNVFLKVYASLGSFRGDARFATWLTRIAINEGLMKLRSRKVTEPFDEVAEQRDEVVARDLQPWEADPESLYSRQEMRSLVEKEVGRLPAPYRLAIMLRDIEQLTTEEAAAAMSVPVATLKTRLFRGRLMLRDALAPHFRTAGRGRAHA